MRTPFFSRREVLRFLLGEARHIEAATENELWRKVWRAFFSIADELRDDGLFLEFQRVCQFYGYQPYPTAESAWKMHNPNLRA